MVQLIARHGVSILLDTLAKSARLIFATGAMGASNLEDKMTKIWDCWTKRTTIEMAAAKVAGGFRVRFTEIHNKSNKIVRTVERDGATLAEAFAAVAKDAKNEDLTELVKKTDLAVWLKQ